MDGNAPTQPNRRGLGISAADALNAGEEVATSGSQRHNMTPQEGQQALAHRGAVMVAAKIINGSKKLMEDLMAGRVTFEELDKNDDKAFNQYFGGAVAAFDHLPNSEKRQAVEFLEHVAGDTTLRAAADQKFGALPQTPEHAPTTQRRAAPQPSR